MSSSKTKILFVFYTLAPGGAEKSVINIANHLADNPEYEIAFFVYDDTEGMLPLIKKSIKVIRANKSTKFTSLAEEYYSKYISFGMSLSKAVSSQNFDYIISVHEQLPEIAGMYMHIKSLLKKSRCRYISMIHNSPYIYKIYNKSLLSRIIQLFLLLTRRIFYNNIVTVSERIKSDIKNYPPQKMIVIHNALNIDKIISGSCEQPVQGIDDLKEGKYILNPARITGQKNQILLIRAFNLIKDKTPYKLVLMGHSADRKYFESVVELIKEFNLEERVIIIGTKPNPYTYIRGAEAVILSSNYESFSLSIHEAMLLKVPVISTKFYGYEEFLNPADCLLADGSEEALAEAMLSVSSVTQLMLENAYRKALNFDSQKIAKDFHHYLKSINA